MIIIIILFILLSQKHTIQIASRIHIYKTAQLDTEKGKTRTGSASKKKNSKYRNKNTSKI
jgi:hypothetical protein